MKLATWMRSGFLLLASVLMCVSVADATKIARVTKPNGTTDWNAGDQFLPDDINGDLNSIYNEFNGNIDSDNLDSAGFSISIITSGCGAAGGSACGNEATPSLGFEDLDDYSDTEAIMNNEKDPGVSGSPNLSTDGEDELETLRYAIRRLGTGINVQRENGALVPVDWWELPVRGPNLVLNPSFQHDDDADGMSDNWTTVDGGGAAPTPSRAAGSQANGYGMLQRVLAGDAGDGLSQVVTRLKASTSYLVLVRSYVNTGDTFNLTITGALGTGEWQSISGNVIPITNTTMETQGAVVKTTAVPGDLTILLLSTAASDLISVANVAVYELNEDWMPFQRTNFATRTVVNTFQDCVEGAYNAVTDLTDTVVVPGPDYTVSVLAIVSFGDVGASGHQSIACQISEDIDVAGANVVSGPIVGGMHSGQSGNITMNYINVAPTAGGSHVYTVECWCDNGGAGAGVDFQPDHPTFGQMTSEMLVEVKRN